MRSAVQPASTGNDIVALAATDPVRTGSYRFYSRILSGGEQSLFDHRVFAGLPFDQFVWLLWSVKESAYKYSSRIDRAPVFAPLKFRVARLDPPGEDPFYKAIVYSQSDKLFSRSLIRGDMIVTAVSGDEKFEDTVWDFGSIGTAAYAGQSAAVRACALASLGAFLPRASLRIEKSPAGFPVLFDGDRPLDIPLSLAHHDRYIAWSFRLPVNDVNALYPGSAG